MLHAGNCEEVTLTGAHVIGQDQLRLSVFVSKRDSILHTTNKTKKYQPAAKSSLCWPFEDVSSILDVRVCADYLPIPCGRLPPTLFVIDLARSTSLLLDAAQGEAQAAHSAVSTVESISAKATAVRLFAGLLIYQACYAYGDQQVTLNAPQAWR